MSQSTQLEKVSQHRTKNVQGLQNTAATMKVTMNVTIKATMKARSVPFASASLSQPPTNGTLTFPTTRQHTKKLIK